MWMMIQDRHLQMTDSEEQQVAKTIKKSSADKIIGVSVQNNYTNYS